MQFGVISTSKFFKICLVGQVQFVFFEKFTKAYYTYLQEIMLFLVNNVHDITSQSVRTDKILKACAHYS